MGDSDATGAIATVAFTAEEARVLTSEVKRDATELWTKLLRLYEGGAHAALGYTSWATYCQAEFDLSQTRASRLLSAGRILALIPEADMPIGIPESQVRALAPLKDRPEAVREVWKEVHEEKGEAATAKDVRDAVQRRIEPPPPTLDDAVGSGRIEPPFHMLEQPRSEKAFNKISDLRTYADDVLPAEVAATYGMQRASAAMFERIGNWILAISVEMRDQERQPIRAVKG